jgi:hypothetical protein
MFENGLVAINELACIKTNNMKRAAFLILILSILTVINGCRHCDCSGENGVSPTFTTDELAYIPNLMTGDTIYFQNNLNKLDTFVFHSGEIIKSEGWCEGPYCCHCPIDDHYSMGFNIWNIEQKIYFSFNFEKDKKLIDKYFELSENGNIPLRSYSFSNILSSLVVNNTTYSSVIVFTTDTNSYQYDDDYVSIWKVYYAKTHGVLRYDCTHNITWTIKN